MKKTLVVILTVLALAGCDTSGGGDGGNRTYAKELWGEWLRMDTGDKWYISDNALKINDVDASMNATLTKQSERVIEVADGSRKYYLYASRIATASFTGAIVTDTGAAGSGRAISGGLGGIHITIANLVNTANELSAVTDGDGKFTAEGVIVGDAYKLTPQGGTSVTVIPTIDGDDIGVVAITSGVNFKTSLIPTQSSTDITELYMNETHQFEIEFENTGDKDCPAPSYAITEPDGVSITGALQGILGTIEPGGKKKVPIGVTCFALASDHEYKKINIKIADGTGKTWEDSVLLRFYKETMGFNIKAEKPVSGILISPDSKTYSFTNVTDGTVVAPRRVSGSYLVVFSGATIETETSYALGIGVEADGDFSAFIDTGRYEPNNTEGAAVSLGAQKIMAFLYKNDVDYYRISYGDFDLPPTPANVSANSADAQVTVSWTAIEGASSYTIYRSDSETEAYAKVGVSASPPYTETVAATGTYHYAVSSVNAGGFESVRSAPAETAVTGPAVPAGVTASAADDQVTVSWNAVEGASSYNVYRSDSQTEAYTEVGVSTSSPYTETVDAMGTYSYEVLAVSASGFESALSAPAEIAVITPKIDVANLTETLSWLAANAANSTHYTLSLTRNETITAQTLSYSGMNITITLKGKSEERIVSLSGNGSLFTVASGVTLILDSGVTLRGHNSNNTSLVMVNSGGNLVLKDGAKITGNRASYYGGGVYVYGGTFTMSGGEISGNTASSPYSGGGVFVNGGTFIKQSGGIIYGSNATNALKNTANNGNAVYVGSSPVKIRNTTVGVGVTLDSAASGSAGGWE
ncbi:MAG: hypothetical protein LBK73_06545 [Treponema sp.]|jgi:hypothetical protein|nr:hypothetical protein [Treponema sp.]